MHKYIELKSMHNFYLHTMYNMLQANLTSTQGQEQDHLLLCLPLVSFT